jgi:hypothetical protein
MNDEETGTSQEGISCGSMRTYTHGGELINNVPYVGMVALGAVIFLLALGDTWGRFTAAAYSAYGLVGTFWIIVFICPYCRYYGTRSCPCGYGQIAARIRPRLADDRFAEKFRRHIPVIVPLWFLPLVVAVPMVMRSFSWAVLVLLVAFVVESFIVLPIVSTQHGCKDCPQKADCPWMRRKSCKEN